MIIIIIYTFVMTNIITHTREEKNILVTIQWMNLNLPQMILTTL